jgi:hypothetical protein
MVTDISFAIPGADDRTNPVSMAVTRKAIMIHLPRNVQMRPRQALGVAIGEF